jgi:hypothetical protein
MASEFVSKLCRFKPVAGAGHQGWQVAMIDELFYPHRTINISPKKVNIRKRQQFGQGIVKIVLARQLHY